MATLRLLEQNFITQFSQSLLALSFVMRSMLALAFSTAVSNQLASASLQFDVMSSTSAMPQEAQHIMSVSAFTLIILLSFPPSDTTGRIRIMRRLALKVSASTNESA